MNFNTVESQANFVFKAILKKLWLDYQDLKLDDPGEFVGVSFDTYLWENLSDLGEVAYELVGEYFSDANQAVIDLGISE